MLKMKSKLVMGFAILATVAGCAGTTGSNPDTVNVTGTVTYNGSPVEGAVVSFSPQGKGYGAVGTTDASGNFTLTSFESGDGAVVGKYGIAIGKTEAGEDAFAAVPAGEETDEDLDKIYAALDNVEEQGEPEDKGLLPERYTSAGSSGLTAEVTEGGENNFTFELTDENATSSEP